MTWPSGQVICPVLIMCMVSMPAMSLAADQNDLKPSIGLTLRSRARWSCSTRLFKSFDCAARCLRRCRRSGLNGRGVRATLVDRYLLGQVVLVDGAPEAPYRGDVAMRLEEKVHRTTTQLVDRAV